MNTQEIAGVLELTSKLMELHNENPFKIRSLAAAAFKISKSGIELSGLSAAELEKIEGIGKGIAQKIVEITETGTTHELSQLKMKTPDGLSDLMEIKGLGPKKVGIIWRELGIESVGELEYACNENRLVELKGFGEKTQETIKKNLVFFNANKNKLHFAYAIKVAEEITALLRKHWPQRRIELCGELYRKCETISEIQILVSGAEENLPTSLGQIPVKFKIVFCPENEFTYRHFLVSSASEHLHKVNVNKLKRNDFSSEEEIYTDLELPFIAPELREGLNEVDLAKEKKLPELIEYFDLKGVLHNHSTYSDGMNTLKEMADYCKSKGYEYFGIADHSQSAFYANGMKPERVLEQLEEINTLNASYTSFKVFKGIESDILNDGRLDYSDDFLKSFDFVIASIHSNLRMDQEKATARIIKAIEHPATRILGHPTGRLLLAREAYPIDHKKVIDACAANKVVIELNAHPYRLDIDWRWIPYCMEKNVLISINPDAHEKTAIADMYFGVCVARKGMLSKEHCLNAFTLLEFENWILNGKK